MKKTLLNLFIQILILIIDKMLLPYIAARTDANTKAKIVVTCDQLNQIINDNMIDEAINE